MKFLKIKNFIGVFSRDTIKETIKKPKCAIIKLDVSVVPGTHWVCYYDNYYFDPFRMPPPIELAKYIKDIQYQDTKSVLCEYYCLYFLKRLNDGNTIYEILIKSLIIKVPWKMKVW